MTNHVIDNSADEEFGKVILWQYDKAENLVALIKSFLGIHDSATKDLWDRMQKELDVDTASEFGLSILGSLLGVPWGTYSSHPDVKVSVEDYRKWLKEWAVLIRTDFAMPDVIKFFKNLTSETNASGDIEYFKVEDASCQWLWFERLKFSFVMGLTFQWQKDYENGNAATTDEINASTSPIEELYDESEEEKSNTISNYSKLYTITKAIAANGFPAAVYKPNGDEGVIFGFDGQQYKEKGDYQIGGFDDSTFISTDEYATETYYEF